MSESPIIEICVISSNTYVVPSVVMLTSARLNKRPESRYRVHYVLTASRERDKQYIRELNAENFEVIIHDAPLTDAEKRIRENIQFKHIDVSSLVRCRIPSILPEAERVIYIDGDTIVRTDLTELYSMDMSHAMIAGVWDVGEWDGKGRHSRKAVGSESYVNAGVLLMNLKRMRESGVAAKLEHRAAHLPKDWHWLDQDVINSQCPDEEKIILPPSYNCVRSLFLLRPWTLKEVNALYQTHYESFLEYEEDALIIHLAGPYKPWTHANCFAADLWLYYYNQSPLRMMPLLREAVAAYPPPRPENGELDVAPAPAPAPASASASASAPAPAPPVAGVPQPEAQRTFQRSYRLFGFIPLLMIKSKPGAVRVRLFDVLPLFRYYRKGRRTRVLLFHCIPIWGTVDRS